MDIKMLEMLAKATAGPIRKMMDRLEARLDALEARAGISSEHKSIADNYAGVWRQGHHAKRGTLATHRSSLWLAMADTREKPGHSGAWRLVSKSGEPPEAE